MMTKLLLYAVAALLLIVVVLGGLYRYELKASAVKDTQIELFEQAQIKNSKAMHQVREERILTDRILSEREAERNTLQDKLSAAKRKIREEQEGGSDADEILNSTMPGFVIDELYDYGY
jgi:hypothetical protein